MGETVKDTGDRVCTFKSTRALLYLCCVLIDFIIQKLRFLGLHCKQIYKWPPEVYL